MLEGIHILNETVKYTASGGSILGGVVAGILALIMMSLIIFSIKDGDYKDFIWIIICLLVLGGISFGCFASYVNRLEYTEYKVTVDSNVSLTEFNERYNIIFHEGLIYTINDKK